MKSYSLDLRQKSLRACDHGFGSQRAIAARLGVSPSFVEKRLRRRRPPGAIAPRPHAGGRRAICHEAAQAHGRRLVHEPPEAPLAERCMQLHAQQGLRVSVPTMGRLVTHLGLPRKKSRFMPMRATPRGSSTRERPIRKRSSRATPSAFSASMKRGATSP